MYTEIDKHCEIGDKRLLMSSIETEYQISYCGSNIGGRLLYLKKTGLLTEDNLTKPDQFKTKFRPGPLQNPRPTKWSNIKFTTGPSLTRYHQQLKMLLSLQVFFLTRGTRQPYPLK